jgi:hypothetical protein
MGILQLPLVYLPPAHFGKVGCSRQAMPEKGGETMTLEEKKRRLEELRREFQEVHEELLAVVERLSKRFEPDHKYPEKTLW